MAVLAAYKAFTDPESLARADNHEQRITGYTMAWAYYAGTIFSRRNGDTWAKYLSDRELYKHTRLIYNPVPQIVDFYVDNLWRPAANEKFEALVTPLRDGTDESIIDAVAQLDQWSNFLGESQKIKRYGAAIGNVFIEAIHDVNRQKILQRTIWPGFVKEFELNDTGDLQSYSLEYDVYDPIKKGTYKFTKKVDKETFSYFRDDNAFIPEGKAAAVEPNPYGFCPAVLIRHSDDGGRYGKPACKDFDKIDEVNSLASHLHDNIHKSVESPVVISTNGNIVPISGSETDANGRLINNDPRMNWMVLKAPGGTGVLDLASKLKLAEAHPFLKDSLASFTDDYPELQAAAIIRENSQLSGAALERMLGPAQNRLNGIQPFYNLQLVKLRQMQMAMGGYHLRQWARPNDQQKKFGNFDLNSYSDGKMEFGLKNSLLVQTTAAEDEELLKARTDRIVAISNLVDLETISAESITHLLDEAKLLPVDMDARKERLRIEGEEEQRVSISPVLAAQNFQRQLGAGDATETNPNAQATQQEAAAIPDAGRVSGGPEAGVQG